MADYKKHVFPVVEIDRDELRAYGYESEQPDSVMEDIARRMSEWFDDIYEDALLSCVRAAGVKPIDND